MTTFYVDSSAWAKLLLDEPESESVVAWVDERLAASQLLVTELHRLAQREGVAPTAVGQALSVLGLALPSPVTFRQAGLVPGSMRSLDALHVTQAIEVGADAFISFDTRQIAAAQAAGIPARPPADLP